MRQRLLGKLWIQRSSVYTIVTAVSLQDARVWNFGCIVICSSYPLVLSVDNLTSTCIQNVVHVKCGPPVCYGFYCRWIVMTCTCSVFIDSVVYGFFLKKIMHSVSKISCFTH